MNVKKAALTIVLCLATAVWFGSEGRGPLAVDPVVRDLCVGIVGVVALSLAAVVRAIGVVVLPLLGTLRLLAVPVALGVLGWLLFRWGRVSASR